ncbi:hypothetical protein [Geodermatophilus tzadiensis]|uniref:hypothetical protein n=1 Tax=Geodermatophilus tzadiensis TaxID=1137988 RepID=UPI0011B22FBD|nr:hypothetical protein [Geodermatophilus tzadiensis]
MRRYVYERVLDSGRCVGLPNDRHDLVGLMGDDDPPASPPRVALLRDGQDPLGRGAHGVVGSRA